MNIIRKLCLWRWELFSAVLLLVILAIGVDVLTWCRQPILTDLRTLGIEKSIQSQAGTWRAEKVAAEKRIHDIRVLLSTIQPEKPFVESEVLAELYAKADAAGFKPTMVQIAEPMTIENGREIPVLVKGTGCYNAIGGFIASVENLRYSTRVRQLSIKGDGKDHGDVSLDFIIMDHPLAGGTQ